MFSLMNSNISARSGADLSKYRMYYSSFSATNASDILILFLQLSQHLTTWLFNKNN